MKESARFSPPRAAAPESPPASPRAAWVALLLLVPVPTLGTWFGLFWEVSRGTPWGQAIYLGGKVWILVLPLFWLLAVDRKRPSWSPPRHGGFGMGVLTGLVMSAGIFAAWFWFGRAWVDPERMREAAAASGLLDARVYLLFALYICTVNAVLEEYVWRWFVFEKSAQWIGRAGISAVGLSALFFTLHHVLALRAQFDWVPALLASAGVFVGGCVWSALYLRYRSIWPGFVSHAIVDVAIFVLGWWLLFGTG